MLFEDNGPYTSIEQIRRKTQETTGSRHWFDPESLRFFRGRVLPTIYHGRFFISSEQYNNKSPRLYTIRIAHDDGTIETYGAFQEYRTAAAAQRVLKRLRGQKLPCANCRKPTYKRNFTCEECEGVTHKSQPDQVISKIE